MTKKKRDNLSILHLSDLHFNRAACEWLGQQKSVDAICISGDLLDNSISAPISLSEQVKWYSQFFQTLSVPVYICSGNHDIEQDDVEWQTLAESFDVDFDEFDLASNNLSSGETNWITELSAPNIYIDGAITELRGWTLGCARYGTTDYSRFRDCDILLAHVPPKGTGTALQSRQDWGCDELAFALQTGVISPKYLLSGHVHRPNTHVANKCKTTIINPGGSAKGPLPNHKVIHLSEN